jgi:hypothetical protein
MDTRKIPRLAIDPAILPKADRAWVVGGTVRDLLRGRQPTDIDIAVQGDAARYAVNLAATCAGRLVRLGKAAHTIHRVVTGTYRFDVCPLKGATIEEDLDQRDFAINAMALPLPRGKLVDCAGGLADLESRRIRMVSERGFKADPLRLLRAFRLIATLGFTLEARTAAAIRRHAHLLCGTAGERVREEWMKILAVDHASPVLNQMAEAGLLREMLDQLRDSFFEPGARGFKIALEPGLAACRQLERLLTHPRLLSPKARAAVCQPPIPQRLKLAALLTGILPCSDSGAHASIALPSRPGKGVVAAGAAVAAMAKRFKLSSSEQTDVGRVLAHYAVPRLLFQAARDGRSIEKDRVRWFRQCGQMTPALLVFAMAWEAREVTVTGHLQNAFSDFCRGLLQLYFDDFQPMIGRPPLVSGHDLIAVFGLAPSPVFRLLLDEVEHGRLAHRLNSRQEALQWIEGYLLAHGIGHSS